MINDSCEAYYILISGTDEMVVGGQWSLDEYGKFVVKQFIYILCFHIDNLWADAENRNGSVAKVQTTASGCWPMVW